MRYKSRAIALSYIKHGEGSIIYKMLTEEKGLQSFIIKGVRSKGAKKRLNLFEPLQISNINATFLPKKNLQQLIDINLAPCHANINIKKKLIAIFIAEVVSKILREREIEKPLFQFLWQLRIDLALCEEDEPNLPILFMIKLSKHMGFYPLNKKEGDRYFNLELGEFTNSNNGLNYYINEKNSHYLNALLKKQKIKIPYSNRRELLLALINYYKLQHHELKNITSHLIIESLRV